MYRCIQDLDIRWTLLLLLVLLRSLPLSLSLSFSLTHFASLYLLLPVFSLTRSPLTNPFQALLTFLSLHHFWGHVFYLRLNSHWTGQQEKNSSHPSAASGVQSATRASGMASAARASGRASSTMRRGGRPRAPLRSCLRGRAHEGGQPPRRGRAALSAARTFIAV